MTAVHQRAVIREAVVALLTAAGTSAGPRVFDTVYDSRTEFPALRVEDAGEEQNVLPVYGAGRAGRKVDRTYYLTITAEIQQTTNYARERDGLLAQVEAAMATAVITGVTDIRLSGYRPDFGGTGDVPRVIGEQRYALTYATSQGNPAVCI